MQILSWFQKLSTILLNIFKSNLDNRSQVIMVSSSAKIIEITELLQRQIFSYVFLFYYYMVTDREILSAKKQQEDYESQPKGLQRTSVWYRMGISSL